MPVEKAYEFWVDSVAKQVIEREEALDRGIEVIRTESGLGASGIPHVGSMSDAVRAYGVSLGIGDAGKENEFITFSDSLDGLRKVPSGLPQWLEKHIGEPVSNIPDPFGDCHKSYADHMSGLLADALKKIGIKFKQLSADKVYAKGEMKKQIEKVLYDWKKVGQIIKDVTGQDKFLSQLPYFPICKACGKIYTTEAHGFDGKKVLYKCNREFTGENKVTGKKIVVKGCGHDGEADYTKGVGKLGWKVDFAARWAALKISFEAYGKDIAESVKVNDEVCRKVLGFEPPLHIEYELFLQKGGKKISKSVGNVLTPQVWLKYGTPQSLLLLMFKRFQGTRELDVTDIPRYMDEVNSLRKIYYHTGLKNEREKSNLTRLYEYVNLLKVPEKEVTIPYSVLTEIAKILPEKHQEKFALEKLAEFKYLGRAPAQKERKLAMERLEFAKNWVEDFEKQELLKPEVRGENKKAIESLISAIENARDGEELQSEIFEIAKRNDVKPAALFKAVYRILLRADRGPRLGPYILEIGKREVIEKLKKTL